MKPRVDWTDAENDLIVREYFDMLRLIVENDQSLVKIDRERELDKTIQRGIKSITWKLRNVSYIAGDLGLPPLPGYAPADGAQKSIADAIRRYVSSHPETFELATKIATANKKGPPRKGGRRKRAVISNLGGLELVAAPGIGSGRKPHVARLVRDFDPAKRDERSQIIGDAGEHRVLEYEKARLIKHGRADLARDVEWTSKVRGDGVGYDIRSFNLRDEERFIEVKSTSGAITSPFYLSRNEREVSEHLSKQWRLYRVFDLAIQPGLFTLKPPLEKVAKLEAESWSVWLA